MTLPICRWNLPAEAAEGDLLARVLGARGLADPEAQEAYLHSNLKALPSPETLPGVSTAASHLLQAMQQGRPIAIYGDYDVDGVTSVAILWHTMRAIAPAAPIETYIPHRVDEGYGLNCEALTQLHEQGIEVVITVDCGVTAVEEVAHARGLGMDMIITDHHRPDDAAVLPDAVAIVHPALPGSTYPWPHLSGSAVAWKLAWQMARQHTGSDRVGTTLQHVLMDTLCLAGLGLIADVMPLADENRIMTKAALGYMHRCRLPGVAALLRACLKPEESVDAEAVGFRMAPRLNAAGRLDDARIALALLMTDDDQEAVRIAEQLTSINVRRQKLVKDIETAALDMAHASGQIDSEHAIVLCGADWNPGVIGIVCSRLVERFHRPVVLICEGESLKGSARSIDGFSVYDAMCRCRSHFETFGGHAMAAGVTVKAGQFEAFRDQFLKIAASELSPEDLVRELRVDTHVSLDELTVRSIRRLDGMRPFGRGNPGPRLLLHDVPIAACKVMGAHSAHLDIRIDGLRCVWWGRGEFESLLPRGRRVDIVGKPAVDSWNGQERVQLIVDDIRPSV